MLGADQAGFHAAGGPPRSWTAARSILGAQVTGTGAGPPGPGAGGGSVPRARHRGGRAPAGRGRRRAADPAPAADDVRAHAGASRRAAGGRKLIVRVDRTELSKNIVRGLAAYRELLATRPEWHGRVIHLAFAYPSRSALPEYRAYTERMRQWPAEITEEFGTPDWNPLILEVKDDYPRSLAACAVADVLLVNPIRDGMNLVAQEGPMLSEHGCALVLSREAGAAATLAADALLVNPYDVSETAAALHQALAMPDAERRRRSDALAAAAAAPARALVRRPAGLRWTRVPDPALAGRSASRGAQLAASAASSATIPSGPVTTRSASAATCGDSALALATAQPGTPSARNARTAANAGRSPRSSPQNRTSAAARSRDQAGQRGALVHARRPQLDDHPAGLGRQPELGGQLGRAARAAGAAPPPESAARRVCTASACPLSSTQVPSGAPRRAQHAGQRARGRPDSRRRRRARSAHRPASAASRSGPAR